MAKDKLRYFEVNQKTDKILTWVLVAFLVVAAFIQVGDFIGLAHVSDGPISYGISRITQSGVGKILLSILSTGLLLTIWENFRRSLVSVKSTFSYVVLALIALMFCDLLVSFVPDGTGSIQDMMHPSRFSSFATRFKGVSSGVQSILQIILSIGILVKFRGRISAFGWSTIICMVATGVISGWFYMYLFNTGVNMLSVGVSAAFEAVHYVLSVIPVVFLRLTMVHRSVHESEGRGDIE